VEGEASVSAALDDEAKEAPSRIPSKTPSHGPRANLFEPAGGERGCLRTLVLGAPVEGVFVEEAPVEGVFIAGALVE